MPRMTRRERLTAIFRGRTPDRPAVKVWGVSSAKDKCIDPLFEPVRDLAVRETDIFHGAGSPFSIYAGSRAEELITKAEEPGDSPDWYHDVVTFHTPQGDLREVHYRSRHGKPGYHKEYLLKDPADIDKLLSLPYEPFEFSREGYDNADREVADAGIAMFGLDHPMYALQRLVGSENFALWSLEADAKIVEAIDLFAQRVREHAARAICAGIRGIFGWVGPELCIPPLMSPSAFERYVFDVDKPLIDAIHDAGGHVWVHCHGRVRNLLPRFAAMGIDVLNPIEPPPMGDVSMAEAFDIVGDGMGLEGNIETHDFMTAAPDTIGAKVRQTLDAGRGRRLILCPSSGYMENTTPTPREIENWLLYIEEGVRYAEAMAQD